ncbi:unnamed protein product [Euphydryas editha]|uniref:Uncharacterized protein n=1 Tax=Euphydryas editha TaxID=104508 RepID=A0AAU9TN41_EUPED|nr:unnamed protein product [Euphydryas editha]
MAAGCGPEESPIGFSQEPTEATTSGQQVQVPESPAPRRARQAMLHDRFLNAQLELNNYLSHIFNIKVQFKRGDTEDNEEKNKRLSTVNSLQVCDLTLLL